MAYPSRRRLPALASRLVVAVALALALALALAFAFGRPAATEAAQPGPVLVFAAASLRNVLDDVNNQYHRETGKVVRVSYAASSALAKQIEAGAPADLFISADIAWMDYLAKRNLIKQASRRNLLGNALVLVAPKGSGVKVEIKPGFPLAHLLGGGRLAMADTSAVPAGKYGRAALETLGVWPSVEDHIAQAENVRVALALVARAEAPLGIVYATDAAAEPKVEVAGTFPADSHPPIVYPAALVATSANPDAARFLRYIESAKARSIFEREGFTVLK